MPSPAFGTSTLTTLLNSGLSWNSLLGGLQWADKNITYSFLSYGSYYATTYPDKTFWNGISPFDSDQMAAFRSALSAWSNVANISFTQVADSSTVAGTLRVGFSSTYAWGTAAAIAYLPNSSASGGDIFLNTNARESGDGIFNTFWYSDFVPGSYGAMTLLHEIGHAIGLKHPFEATSNNAATTTSSLNSIAGSTLMSYTSDAARPDVIGFSMYPTTPMPLDIIAAQYLYGANLSFNAGDTVYSFKDTPGTTYFQTIWDAGGKNTLAFSGSTNSIIDLREGRGSYVGNMVYESTAARTYAYATPNIYIAYGTQINSVRLDGIGNDYITLNANGNAVSAGAGNDTVVAGSGNDTIDGGAGLDQVVFSGQQSQYTVSPITGGYALTFAATGATTFLRGIETLVFGSSQVQVATLNNAPTGTLQLVGDLSRGSTLSVLSTVNDVDGIVEAFIQWKSNGSNIVGANGSTLLLNAEQLGQSITVAVSYTDGRGNTELVASSPSAVVRSSPATENSAPTFSMSRIGATLDLGSDDKIAAVARLSDGKLLVAGTSGQDFFVARFNANGTVDTGYGLNGKTKVNVDSSDLVRSMAVQVDGSVIVVGEGSSIDAAVARFLPNGSLDLSFGSNGLLANATAPDRNKLGTIAAIAMQPDGKFVVGGADFLENSLGLARYHSNGTLDLMFGTGGLVKTVFGTNAKASSVTILPNGKILVAGQTNTGAGTDYALVRYNVDGTIDTSFAFDGFLTLNASAFDAAHTILPLADGKFLISGVSGTSSYSPTGLTVMRINADGTFDTSFDGDGQVRLALSLKNTNAEQGRTVLQGDGKILVIATVTGVLGADVVIMRLNTNGSLDTTFNGVGKVTLDLTVDDLAFDLIVQDDGKIVLAGASGATTSHDMALLRLNADGTFDRTFVSSNNLALANTLDNAPVFLETRYMFSKTAPVVLDSNVQISDLELNALGSYDGSSLILSRAAGANSADEFSALSGGSMQALVAGAALVVNNLAIGTVSANSNGRLELRFGPAATQSLVSQAMAQIAYYNSSDAPESQVNIQWIFSDGNTAAQGSGSAKAVIGSTVVQITPTNDAPVAKTLPYQTVTLGRPFSYVLPAGTFTDPDGDLLTYSFSSGSQPTPWLSFDPVTQRFSGTTGDGAFVNTTVIVTATDPSGSTANAYLGLTFTLPDTTAPRIYHFSPYDGNTAVAITDSIQLHFDETVFRGQGAILLKDGTGKIIESFDVASSTAIDLIAEGNYTVKLTPSSPMPYGTQLFWTIPAGSFVDKSGNQLASITNYDFTTVKFVNSAATGAVVITGEFKQGQSLDAVAAVVDKDGLGSFAYRWMADGVVIPGAIGTSLTLTEAQVGKRITVIVAFTDGAGSMESISSLPSASVVNVNDAPVGRVDIIGENKQGATLSLSPLFTDADGLGSFSYQWYASGQIIAGKTGATLLLDQSLVGKSIHATVSYTDGHATRESISTSMTLPVANVNDAPTGAVSIVGAAKQGETLTVSAALTDLDGMAGTLSYQWSADGVAIAGATGTSVQLTENQVGKFIAVAVSYTDGGGTLELVTSAPTTAVANLNDVPIGRVDVIGEPRQGSTLTASALFTDADGLGSLSYQWYASGQAISGKTGATIALDQTLVGKAISVTVSYLDGQGTKESVQSSPTTFVVNVNDAPVGRVDIIGENKQGATLSLSPLFTDADGLGSFSYQWYASGQIIAGKTGATLLLDQSLVGKSIHATISYVDTGLTRESVSSAATRAIENVNDVPTGAVVLLGTARQGNILTVQSSLNDADGLGALRYQWFRESNIVTGAVAQTYLLGEADVDKVMSVRVSYIDGYGNDESVASEKSTSVANINDRGSVTLVGSVDQGAVMVATISDPDGVGAVGYQWQSSSNGTDWLDIAGATSDSYIVGAAQARTQIRAQAQYIDGHGTSELVTSMAIGGTGADRLIGSSTNDELHAGGGNDTLNGGAGNDLLDGGAGIDMAIFAGNFASYILTKTTSGFVLTDSSGVNGIDTLVGVERLLFGDRAIALDTDSTGNAGQAYRLYQAAFARTPDSGGVGYWMAALDGGTSLSEVASNFIASAEYQALYPASLSYSELIGRYYQNILGRPAEQGGLNYWVSVLDQNIATVPQVLAFISESAENISALAPIIGGGFPYVPFG